MDPVNGLSSIVQLLRQQIAEKTTRLEKKSNKSSSKKADSGASLKKRSSVQQLEQQISEQIRSLDKEDSNHQTRALQIFIGSVLAWEFGDSLVQDERFPELLNEVCRMISTDENIKHKMDAMLNTLTN